MTDQPDQTPRPEQPPSQPGAVPPPAGATPPGPPPGQPGQAGQPAYAGAAAPLSENDARMWAMIAHLGGIILGFLSPLIVWLVFRERSELVDDQGKEALNFQITLLIAYVVGVILLIVLIGLIILLIAWLASIVLSIIGGLAANRGEHYRYPFTLRLVK